MADMDRRRMIVANDHRILPHARVIVKPNNVYRRPVVPSPYNPMLQPPFTREPVTPAAQPMHRMVVRPARAAAHSGNVVRILRIPPDPVPRTGIDPFRRETFPRTQDTHMNRGIDRPLIVPRITPPDVIDVGSLAFQAEKAIDQCGIMTNRQIWFEAIMMTFGENMTVLDASLKICVNRTLLFRLMNIVRNAMGFTPLEGTIIKQFDCETVAIQKTQFPPGRVIRIVQQGEVNPQTELSLELNANSATRPAEDSSLSSDEVQMEYANEEYNAHVVAITGRDIMRESLYQIKCSHANDVQHTSIDNAKKTEVGSCQQTLAREYASIASMRTVLREEQRMDFSGNYDELEAFFKELLVRHKQDSTPSVVRALASFVANKKANFNDTAAKEGVKRQLMRTMLRMALFERRLEAATVDLPHEAKEERDDHTYCENGKKEVDESKETSEDWLWDTVAELSVPITVTDINIVLDLSEKKRDRACLKALYRLVSPLVEKDPMMRVTIERLLMDGYSVGARVPHALFEFWRTSMKSMLACLLLEYPPCLEKWKSLADIHHAQNVENNTVSRRESVRIKARESTVPDLMYLDKIFIRDLKKSFVTFLKELQSSGFPMSESTVISIGEKILKMVDETRCIKRESWTEWLLLREEDSALYEYLHRDN